MPLPKHQAFKTYKRTHTMQENLSLLWNSKVPYRGSYSDSVKSRLRPHNTF